MSKKEQIIVEDNEKKNKKIMSKNNNLYPSWKPHCNNIKHTNSIKRDFILYIIKYYYYYLLFYNEYNGLCEYVLFSPTRANPLGNLEVPRSQLCHCYPENNIEQVAIIFVILFWIVIFLYLKNKQYKR